MSGHRGTVRKLWAVSVMSGTPTWEFRCGRTHLCRVRYTAVADGGWRDAVAYALVHFWASEPDHTECTYSRAYASVGWSG